MSSSDTAHLKMRFTAPIRLLMSPRESLASIIPWRMAFSAKGPNNEEGFFRPVVANKVVKGPLVATYSSKDIVVGLTYAVASRLARDNTKAVGDANDQYGGIGRNGAQNCDVGVSDTLHSAGTPYTDIPLGKVVSYNGSDGLINNHSDITNAAVTYLFASALTRTS